MSNLIKKAENSAEYLRSKRKKLFEAFDIYKSNVYYGIIIENQKEKESIISWYNKCLNLDSNAINNPPMGIIKYLK